MQYKLKGLVMAILVLRYFVRFPLEGCPVSLSIHADFKLVGTYTIIILVNNGTTTFISALQNRLVTQKHNL